MIKNWTVKNFKSIYGQKTLEFGRITLFAGANSSGKSTILQSILLVTQTLQSQVISRPIILNGHIVRLGTFDDILSNGAADREVSIGFQLKPSGSEEKNSIAMGRYFYSREYLEKVTSVSVDFSFVAEGVEENKESLQLQPALKKAKVKFTAQDMSNNVSFEFKKRTQSVASALRSLQIAEALVPKENFSALEYEVRGDNPIEIPHYRSFHTGMRPAGVFVRHFLPSYLSAVFEVVADECEKVFRAFSEPGRFRGNYYSDEAEFRNGELNEDFRNLVISIYDEIIESYRIEKNYRSAIIIEKFSKLRSEFSFKSTENLYSSFDTTRQDKLARRFFEKKQEIFKIIRGGRKNQFELTGVPLPETITFAADFAKQYFSTKLKYLGPLRDEPKSVYPIAGNTEPNDIGYKGEYTAAVLDANKNTLIEYYPTDTIPFDNDANASETVKLQDAVLDWLSYMGIGERYTTEDKGKLGHELKISTMGASHLHDLTHVGVGVSQVLPILVLSLLAEKGSTLIFEQPELHLNPRVQTRLADFFASQLLLGKQCIIETHSEYIVSRLRYLSSEASDATISNELKMYFVEKGNEGSNYRLVEMAKNGVIRDWPDGFFDESEKNAAAMIKSRLKKEKMKLNRYEE